MNFLLHQKYRVAYFHVAYWILLMTILTWVWGSYDGDYTRQIFYQLWSLPARLFVVYITIGLLFPKTYKNGKFLTFFVLFLLALSMVTIFIQRPIIVYIVEGLYLPYKSPSFFNLIALVNSGIHVALGSIPLIFFHQSLFASEKEIENVEPLIEKVVEQNPKRLS